MFGHILLVLLILLLGIFALLGIVAAVVKPYSVYKNQPERQNPMEGKRVIFVEDEKDALNADGVRGHLLETDQLEKRRGGLYENCVKRLLDILLSFGGLLLLSPIYAGVALAIILDDPGPVLFTQKRVGKNKRYFKLHKFRSMKMSTPHDVPTHMLQNPEQYITRVGKFIRAHSLDELPQIWDIFVGNMSIVGPRPALWNQDLLTAQREQYGANAVVPGLTGWAQVNGRDELNIEDKAKCDGEYAQKLSFALDCKCFFASIHVFKGDRFISEGKKNSTDT